MKVALLGYGLAGRVFHAPHIHACDGLELSYILSSRKEEIKSLYPKVNVVSNIDELFENDIDLVVIATPNDTHVSLATKALNSDCHVIIDKPFTPSLEESKKLLNLAAQKNKVISSFHNRRFDGDFLTIKKIIKESSLGEIKLFESNFNRFRPEVNKDNWRETTDIAGGVFYDLAPHILDQALNLFGTPEYIYLHLDNMRNEAKNDDYFKAQLYYTSMKVELNAHCFQATPAARFRVQGSKGGFEKYGMDPQEAILKERGFSTDQGVDKESNYGSLYLNDDIQKVATLDGCYLKYYENFRDVILNKAELAVKGKDIIDIQYGLELMIESARSGKKLKWENS